MLYKVSHLPIVLSPSLSRHRLNLSKVYLLLSAAYLSQEHKHRLTSWKPITALSLQCLHFSRCSMTAHRGTYFVKHIMYMHNIDSMYRIYTLCVIQFQFALYASMDASSLVATPVFVTVCHCTLQAHWATLTPCMAEWQIVTAQPKLLK